MKAVFSESFLSFKPQILVAVENFDQSGEVIYEGRNTVKIFQSGKLCFNIKAFKKPNFINKIAYRYFRQSKAARSFEYAQLLVQKGIGTPAPIAFMEDEGGLFGRSYYVCEHIDYDYTFREIITLKDIPKRNEILRQFTAFTHAMHEKGVEFLDHSPGNTLIVDKGDNTYAFYLVDLNRMRFHEQMSLKKRIDNFRKLTAEKRIVVEMSNDYAALTGHFFVDIFNEMWAATENFQNRFKRKKQIKKCIKFWKST